MNWLFIAVLAIIGLCGFAGYKKGLVKVLFSLLTAVLSLVLVSFITPYVGGFLKDHTGLHTYVKEKSSAMVSEWNENREVSSVESRFAAIDGYAVPDFVKSYLKSGHTAETLQLEFNDYISDKIADMTISAASFLIAFVVIVIVLNLLAVLLNTIMKLPVLNSINHIGGLVAGLAEGLLMVWVFFLVITLLCSTQFGKECMRMIEEGKILSILYDANPLIRILM